MSAARQYDHSPFSEGASPWSTEARVKGADITLFTPTQQKSKGRAGGFPQAQVYRSQSPRYANFGTQPTHPLRVLTYSLCALCFVLLSAIGILVFAPQVFF